MKYRVLKRRHYINNRICLPGEIVTLPAGVKPGKLLEPIETPTPAEAAEPKNKGGRPRKDAAEAA